MSDIVEGNWNIFLQQCETAEDFDGLLAAQSAFHSRLLVCTMLSSAPLRRCVDELLECVLVFAEDEDKERSIDNELARHSALFIDLLQASSTPSHSRLLFLIVHDNIVPSSIKK